MAAIDGGVATAAQQLLGARLKHLRLGRRLSLRQLGELIGTSASFISQLVLDVPRSCGSSRRQLRFERSWINTPPA
jgi:hypothetical protein